jgi:AmiR/NasT family two-component response regulator
MATQYNLRCGSTLYLGKCSVLRIRARAELQGRKMIDRAKSLLMQRQNLSEQEAYEKLRKTAMDKGLKLDDVAQQMLDVADLLE